MKSPGFRKTALLGVLAALAASGVLAQPAAPPPLETPPSAPETPPSTPEEAPPVIVPTPAPLAAPPIQPSDVAPAPPPRAVVAEKPSEAVAKRARYDVAIIQALDKITAESIRFEAAVGRPVRYKNLIFTVKACEASADDEPIKDSIVYLTIDSQPKPAPGKPTPPPRQSFRGWMYASSPGLNPLQHPVYDAWLITCRAASPVAPVSR